MSKVLLLNANSKTKEYSRTSKITEAFIETYKKVNPNDELIRVELLDLYYPDIVEKTLVFKI